MFPHKKENKWMAICEFIDQNEFFNTKDFTKFSVKQSSISQYIFYLNKALFIEKIAPGKFKSLKPIKGLSIYKIKEIGFDLE